MKALKSLFFFSLLLLINSSNAQVLDQNQESNSTNELGIKLDRTNFNIQNSFTLRTEQNQAPIKKEEETVFKDLQLPKAQHRFNLNFVKVDPCTYNSPGSTNLYLLRNGYDPYYANANFIPSFTEQLACSFAKSLLSQLR